MQLPQIPTQKMHKSPIGVPPPPQAPPSGEHRRRRLLPQINTATYTKKVADLNQRSSPMGILPVGYPVFLPCTNEEDNEEIPGIPGSPVNMLPDPDSMQLQGLNKDQDHSANKLGAPLRQSPASSIPPVLGDNKDDTSRLVLLLTFDFLKSFTNHRVLVRHLRLWVLFIFSFIF